MLTSSSEDVKNFATKVEKQEQATGAARQAGRLPYRVPHHTQQCVCIYTAVYSQTLTAISIEAVISQRTCAQGLYYLIISYL